MPSDLTLRSTISGQPTNLTQTVLYPTGFCKFTNYIIIDREVIIGSAFGGVAIIIGLWTYGYNIMRNLGNRITLHSPSRGFSMELGSAITVILATRLSTYPCLI